MFDIGYSSNSNGFNISAGRRDGSAEVTVSNADPRKELRYEWAPVSSFESRVSDLAEAGTYKVKVSDGECTVVDSIMVTSEDSLSKEAMPMTTRGNWLNPNTDFFGSRNQSALIMKTNSTERMRITEDGKVGIGTNSPAEKLDVDGNAVISGNIKIKSFEDPSIETTRLLRITPGGFLEAEPWEGPCILEPDPIPPGWQRGPAYWKAVTGILYTCSYDKVGIGTNNPQEILEVNGNIKINGARLHVKSDGRVGIGTTQIPSAYKLAVKGNIIAEDVTVQLSGAWNDYVFEDNYELRSISELEQFIKKHKRLPDMPPASDIEKNGIPVSQIITNIVKHQEELTLYIIEQNKKIEALQKELLDLKK